MPMTNERPFRSRFGVGFKVISAFIILTFLAQDFVQAQGGTPLWASVSQAKAHSKTDTTDNKLNNITIPAESGLTRKVEVHGSGDVIINIQDAHAKLGAQQSISNILDNLVKNYNLNLVAIEGATSRVDTSLISSFPVAEVKAKTAEYLLKEGRISAAEFYSMVAKEKVSVYGVDDASLYNENVTTFKTVIEQKTAIRQELKGLKKLVAELEGLVYSAGLKDMAGRKLLHKNGDCNQLSINSRLGANKAV